MQMERTVPPAGGRTGEGADQGAQRERTGGTGAQGPVRGQGHGPSQGQGHGRGHGQGHGRGHEAGGRPGEVDPRISRLAAEIVAREGGFVDDPDDPGGPTNRGVTLGTLRRLGIDLDGDGDSDLDDLRALTAADARRIFIRNYFFAPGIDRLPVALQPQLFDMYVNAGAAAVVILQRLLGEMGWPVTVDGLIGPETLRAARAAAAAAPEHIADAYAIARREWYYRLADRRPGFRKYVRRRDGGKGGWIRRAEGFLSPRFRLSAAEHAERVAAWD